MQLVLRMLYGYRTTWPARVKDRASDNYVGKNLMNQVLADVALYLSDYNQFS